MQNNIPRKTENQQNDEELQEKYRFGMFRSI